MRTCTDTTTCGCYDNCGCVNPTIFGCITHSGTALPNLDVIDGEDGESILSKIDNAISDIGKVGITDEDVCPKTLLDKLEAGINIVFTQVGTGCDIKLRIDAVEGATPVDVNVKVTSNDTTTGYLSSKVLGGTYVSKTLLNPSGNEQLRFDVVPETLISEDEGNLLILGDDGKLMTSIIEPDGSETKLAEGVGVNISGTGTTGDPYVISTNPSIQVARSCFDATWRAVTLVATGNADVVYVSGAPQYRYRFDGSIEFKGSATYTVAFDDYSSSDREFTVTIGNIPTTCISAGEQAGTVEMKAIMYIDVPQASADQITQLYGYIIRKVAQNISIKFQSSFTGATSKTIVVNFDGCIQHPSI